MSKPRLSDPTRHITSFKTAWKPVRTKVKVRGRWHDNRHTLITELAESGTGDQTIMEIAGQVDPRCSSTTATSASSRSGPRSKRL